MFNLISHPDETAVINVLRGQREAFSILVERHLPAVEAVAFARTANQTDVEDIAQETFLRAYSRLAQLRERRKFRPWLLQIARNAAHDLLAQRCRDKTIAEDAPTLESVQPDIERRELFDTIRRQIDALEEPYREILVLRYFGALTDREIGGLLNITPNAAKKRASRARQALGARLFAQLEQTRPRETPDAAKITRIMAVIAVAPLPVREAAAAVAVSGSAFTAMKIAASVVAVGGITSFAYFAQVNNEPTPVDAVVQATSQDTAAGPSDGRTTSVDDASAIVPAASQPIATRIAQATRRVEATVEVASDGVEVYGHTVDDNGGALGNATVTAIWMGGEIEVSSDADGAFLFVVPTARIERNEIAFTRTTQYEGNEVKLRFVGKFQDNVIEGNFISGGTEIPVQGTRVESDGASPFGVWDTLSEFQGRNVPGRMTIGRDDAGALTGFWTGEYGDGALTDFQAVGEISVNAKQERWRARSKSFDLPREGIDDLQIVLSATAGVAGIVVDEQGNPVPDMHVLLEGREDRVFSTELTGLTTEEGRFHFAGLNAGEYRFVLSKNDAPFPMEGQIVISGTVPLDEQVSLAEGEYVENVRLVWQARTALSGVVTDTAGQPIEGIEIYASFRTMSGEQRYASFNGKTNDAGEYAVGTGSTEDGIFHFSVRGEGYIPQYRDQILYGSEQNFALVKSPVIKGRVIDSATQAPITNFAMAVHAATEFGENELELAPDALRSLKTQSNRTGEFSIVADAFGAVRIITKAAGHRVALTLLEAEPGETVSGVTIALERAGELRGLVVNSDGEPISGARVFWGIPFQNDDGEDARTNAAGEFTIARVHDSFDVLSAFSRNYAMGWTDNLAEPVRIVLAKGGSIEGTITVDGQPVANAAGVLVGSSLETMIGRLQGRADGAGRYSVDGVTPGTVIAEVSLHGTERWMIREMEVRDGETTAADFNFETGYTASVEGDVRVNGEPPAMARLRIVYTHPNGDRENFIVNTDSTGHYRVDGVPAGAVEFHPYWVMLESGERIEPGPESIRTQSSETTRHDLDLSH